MLGGFGVMVSAGIFGTGGAEELPGEGSLTGEDGTSLSMVVVYH